MSTAYYFREVHFIRLCQRFHHLSGIVSRMKNDQNTFVILFHDLYHCLCHKIIHHGEDCIEHGLIQRKLVISSAIHDPVRYVLEKNSRKGVVFLYHFTER